MPQYDLGNLDVLIVEKNPFMRKVERWVLRELGITQVRETGDTAKGYEYLSQHTPDLIMTDWGPGLDGPDFIRRVRSAPDSPDPFVPIIVVTANTELRHVVEARDAGMTEFLAKPISGRLLYHRIKSVIESNRLFIRSHGFFGPDRRRRRIAFDGQDRRAHANRSGEERRSAERPFSGEEKRQGYPGFRPGDRRVGVR